MGVLAHMQELVRFLPDGSRTHVIKLREGIFTH